MGIIIVLSVICCVLAGICFYLIARKMVTDEMLESKDRIIMELSHPKLNHLSYSLPPWVDLEQMEKYLREPTIDKELFFEKYPHLKSEPPGK